MNKIKAPKDGTPEEFVAEFEKRHGRPYDCAMTAIINTMKEMLAEPAPNPFTPDQIAWMREMQRCGMAFAAMTVFGAVMLGEVEPEKKDGTWVFGIGFTTSMPWSSFLNKVLKVGDEKPLRLADYAPLEGAADV